MYYILIGKHPVEVDNVTDWINWFGWMSQHGARHVESTTIPIKRPFKKDKRSRIKTATRPTKIFKKLNKWRSEEVFISTIFLGIDHGFFGNAILFETMIFGGRYEGYQRRYETFDEAREHHNYILGKWYELHNDNGTRG